MPPPFNESWYQVDLFQKYYHLHQQANGLHNRICKLWVWKTSPWTFWTEMRKYSPPQSPPNWRFWCIFCWITCTCTLWHNVHYLNSEHGHLEIINPVPLFFSWIKSMILWKMDWVGQLLPLGLSHYQEVIIEAKIKIPLPVQTSLPQQFPH